mmetsp:Transcript_106507/g.306184  ORF Transcript_106507/g.306184 Transcript_106507/m.306184 type:complete len:266 (-) Transcript_106507:1328-2125(-)
MPRSGFGHGGELLHQRSGTLQRQGHVVASKRLPGSGNAPSMHLHGAQCRVRREFEVAQGKATTCLHRIGQQQLARLPCAIWWRRPGDATAAGEDCAVAGNGRRSDGQQLRGGGHLRDLRLRAADGAERERQRLFEPTRVQRRLRLSQQALRLRLRASMAIMADLGALGQASLRHQLGRIAGARPGELDQQAAADANLHHAPGDSTGQERASVTRVELLPEGDQVTDAKAFGGVRPGRRGQRHRGFKHSHACRRGWLAASDGAGAV